MLQNNILREIVNASWDISNFVLHRHLNMRTLLDTIRRKTQNNKWRLHSHSNIGALQMTYNRPIIKRRHDSSGPSHRICFSVRSDSELKAEHSPCDLRITGGQENGPTIRELRTL